MAEGPINLSLFGSKVARETPNTDFAFFFVFVLIFFPNCNFTNAHVLCTRVLTT